MERRLSVGEVARISGLSIRTLQYYDAQGIFESSGRLANGRRYYTEDSLAGLEQVVFYSRLGLTLEQARSLRENAAGPGRVLERQEILLLGRIEELQTLVSAIEVFKGISAAGFAIPWPSLAKLIASTARIDLEYWKDYRYEEGEKERLAALFPSYEAAMAFYRELKLLLMKASTYKAAEVPVTHELARRLAREWVAFKGKFLGGDESLAQVFQGLERGRGEGAADTYKAAKEYLDELFAPITSG